MQERISEIMAEKLQLLKNIPNPIKEDSENCSKSSEKLSEEIPWPSTAPNH
mgnify:CR=1 FL=1|jgi:hypothetical protein